MAAGDQSGGGSNNAIGIQVLRSIAQAIAAQTQAFQSFFPQQTGTATSATSGSASALPSSPAIYLTIQATDGNTYKVPAYKP